MGERRGERVFDNARAAGLGIFFARQSYGLAHMKSLTMATWFVALASGAACLPNNAPLQRAMSLMQQGNYVAALPELEAWCKDKKDKSDDYQCASLLSTVRMQAYDQRAKEAARAGDFKAAASAQERYCDVIAKRNLHQMLVAQCEQYQAYYEAKARGESPPAPNAGVAFSPAAPRGDGTEASPSAPLSASSAAFVAASPQLSAYALIIGIEKYRDVPAATGARADASRFEAVARKTLGIKDEHLRVAVDDRATKSDLEGHLAWLKSSVPAGSRIYVFFSGHGAPDTAGGNGSPYLFPYDGNPRSVATSALPVAGLMASLGQTRAKDVLVVLDSCFSGAGGRSVLPPGARPLMRVKDAAPAAQVALFTAASASEISGPAPGDAMGLFTKYVTDGLGTGAADVDGDGQISLQELADWVKPRVARDARKDNREQTPTVAVGSNVVSAGSFSVAWGFATK
jgi:hypothetical protein